MGINGCHNNERINNNNNNNNNNRTHNSLHPMNHNNQHQLQQYRAMSKFLTKSATKRLPLTTKRARKGYYKGKGGTKQGSFRGKAGRYVLDPEKMLQLIVPDLEDFKLKPYIAKSVPKRAPEDRI
eukprot:CAMPEP_0184858534 /NCGR_PEP_ID=MMETSP0580-20130426/3618_1 /TAXON_ID=1118495 /ORGANISM="Dactyliosolen fragilissimus" /LENGTH=124 /DNA_ID=CAMNT_0027354723 /DNA_START=109 /DNA_END=483 /DNA_ORIENTATION=-